MGIALALVFNSLAAPPPGPHYPCHWDSSKEGDKCNESYFDDCTCHIGESSFCNQEDPEAESPEECLLCLHSDGSECPIPLDDNDNDNDDDDDSGCDCNIRHSGSEPLTPFTLITMLLITFGLLFRRRS